MPKLSSLKNIVRKITIEIEGEEIHLEVRPHFLTPARELELEELNKADNPEVAMSGLFNFFCDYVVGWDLEDDDGTVLPITHETLSNFPSTLILEIMMKSGTAAKGN